MCRKLILFVLLFGIVSAANAGIGPYQINSADPNLVAYFMLDDASGTTALNSSVASTQNGYILPGAQHLWYPSGDPNAIFGGCLELTYLGAAADDFNDRVRVNVADHNKGPVLTVKAGSYALWFKQTAMATESKWKFMMGSTPDGSNRFFIDTGKSNNVLNVGIGDQFGLDTNITTLNINQWYHLALVKDANMAVPLYDPNSNGTYMMYVDGIDMAPGRMRRATMTNSQYPPNVYKQKDSVAVQDPEVVDVGGSGKGPQYLGSPVGPGIPGGSLECQVGFFDEVGVYNKRLTRAEIVALAGADPNKAYNPSPDNYHAGVRDRWYSVFNPAGETLTWSSGTGATSADVYFGTPGGLALLENDDTGGSTPTGALVVSTVYAWRVDENNAGGTTTGDVWEFLTRAGAASGPSPTGTVSPDVGDVVSWTSGEVATSADIYWDTDQQKVIDANVANGGAGCAKVVIAQPVASTSVTVVANYTDLVLGDTLYWKVDSNNGASGFSPGSVWNYTISDSFVLDDFESYTGTSTGTKPLKSTWTDSGGTGGFYALKIEVSGNQCMEMDYYNVYGGVMRPYASAMDFTFSLGAKAYYLNYQADGNVDDLKMKVKDDDGDTGESVLSNPVTTGSWTQWRVDMNDFRDGGTNVDIDEIREIELGVVPFATTLGTVYFDDITARPAAYPGELAGDIDGDKDVDSEDLRLFALDWQSARVNIVNNPQFTGGVDANGWPIDWEELSAPYDRTGSFPWIPANGTGDDANGYYVLTADNADGQPAPCAQLDLDVNTNTWTDGDVYQAPIDVNAYVGQDLDFSFQHKADMATWEDAGTTGDSRGGRNIFELRPGLYNDPNRRPGAYIWRRARMNPPTCDECVATPDWDWEDYTTTLEVTADNLHLFFRVCGRSETTADPARKLKLDRIIVKPAGSSLPAADLDEDNDVDFDDYDVVADDWMKVIPIWPAW